MSKIDLEKFLYGLSSRPTGKIVLTNLYFSLCKDIVTREKIFCFLKDCSVRFSKGDVDAETAFRNTSDYTDDYLCLLRVCPTTISPKTVLCSIISARNFNQYILDQAKINKGPFKRVSIQLPKKPYCSKREKSYRKNLRKITSSSLVDWVQDSSSLGVFEPITFPVWLTIKERLMEKVAASHPEKIATQIRDSLGLVNNGDETYFISLDLSAKALHEIKDQVYMARPSFADKGNSRWAAYIDNENARKFYSVNWGQTVDLKKLQKRSNELNGLPERVCKPIRLSTISKGLSIEAAGWVHKSSICPANDRDHDTFSTLLSGGKSIAKMIQCILDGYDA